MTIKFKPKYLLLIPVILLLILTLLNFSSCGKKKKINLPEENKKITEEPETDMEKKIVLVSAAHQKNFNLDRKNLTAVLKGLCMYDKLSPGEVKESEEAFLKGLPERLRYTMPEEGWLYCYRAAARGDNDDLIGKGNGLFTEWTDSMIEPYMDVASVGCGSGPNIFRIAGITGNTGKVYAVDIDGGTIYFINLIKLRRLILYDRHYPQVIALQNKFEDVRFNVEGKQVIEDESLDLILLQQMHLPDNVFTSSKVFSKDELDKMKKLIESLVKSLRKDGRIVIIEGNMERPLENMDKVKEGMDKLGMREIERYHSDSHRRQVFQKL